MRGAPLLLIMIAASGGCALQRAPIAPNAALDAPGLDAGELDAPALDVPGLDAGELDAPDVPDDASTCVPTTETCDRRDEDCNGVIDDGGACATSGACVGFTVAGIAYQSCPAITGLDGWRGACRRMGTAGYDLAIFPTPTDQDQVRARLATLGLTEPHWVGLNDFEINGTYVWLDRVSRATPTLPADPAKRCVMFRTDGTYEELQCDQSQRVLCSAPLSVPPCVVREEGAGCDLIDQDCDGSVDEGNECEASCEAHTFWDHVLYACSTGATAEEADARCDGSMPGARLASIDHATELALALSISSGDAWVGLKQGGDASEGAGWGWVDSTNEFGIPPTVPPWASGEPNDGGGGEDGSENCGLVARGRDGFDDRRCTDRLDFLCEGSWRR